MHVMVTVDLHEATPEQRAVFNQQMRAAQWTRCAKVSTAFCAAFKSDAGRATAIAVTERAVQQAASEAHVTAYGAVCAATDEKPTTFSS